MSHLHSGFSIRTNIALDFNTIKNVLNELNLLFISRSLKLLKTTESEFRLYMKIF